MIKDALIRNAQTDDAGTIAKIHVDSWRDVYKGILPETYLRRMNYGQMVQSVRTGLLSRANIYLVADDPDGGSIGYICGGPERSGHPIYQSEVYELYIAPEFQRRGVGRRLLSALATRLHNRRFYAMMVWVLASNPNHRFYEKSGGLYLNVRTISFGGRRLKAAAYGWIDITLAFIDDTAGSPLADPPC